MSGPAQVVHEAHRQWGTDLVQRRVSGFVPERNHGDRHAHRRSTRIADDRVADDCGDRDHADGHRQAPGRAPTTRAAIGIVERRRYRPCRTGLKLEREAPALQLAQLPHERVRTGKTRLRVLLERRGHHSLDPVQQLRLFDQRRPRLAHRWRCFLLDGVHCRFRIRAAKRRLPGQHFVEHDPERPDVAPRVGVEPLGLLRGHIGDRAERRPLHRQTERVFELGKPEVENLDAVVRQDEIARLDVAMNDTLRVRFCQSLRHLRRDVERLLDRQRPVSEPGLEGLPLIAGHDDEELTIVGFLDVVNRADVAVVGGRRGLCFADEPLLRCVVVAPLGGKELERDTPLEPRVPRLVHDPHAAATELGDDCVLGNGLPDGDRFCHVLGSRPRSRDCTCNHGGERHAVRRIAITVTSSV